MAEIIPFHGLRYDEKVVGDVAKVIAPPYDVISPSLQDELHERRPYNVVRIALGRDQPGDGPVENKYQRAKQTIRDWISRLGRGPRDPRGCESPRPTRLTSRVT